MLKKEYKYVPSSSSSSEKADEDGIADSMLGFSWERDVEAKVGSNVSLANETKTEIV